MSRIIPVRALLLFLAKTALLVNVFLREYAFFVSFALTAPAIRSPSD